MSWKDFNFIDKIDWVKVDNLVPAIIQDIITHDVLMLGYCDKEAIKLTQNTGKMHFFSRTKQKIWMKGEESGNVLNVKNIFLDCDNDTLLVLVKPIGDTCHKGNKSCFNTRINFLAKLEDIIDKRVKENDIEKSYVAKMFQKGRNKIAQHLGEEAVEVVISSINETEERFLEESADLIFHYLLLLKNKGFEMNDVIDILKKRHMEKER